MKKLCQNPLCGKQSSGSYCSIYCYSFFPPAAVKICNLKKKELSHVALKSILLDVMKRYDKLDSMCDELLVSRETFKKLCRLCKVQLKSVRTDYSGF